jgi:hypothetical protein
MRTHLHIITWDIPRSKPEPTGVRPKIPVKFCNAGGRGAIGQFGDPVRWTVRPGDDAWEATAWLE